MHILSPRWDASTTPKESRRGGVRWRARVARVAGGHLSVFGPGGESDFVRALAAAPRGASAGRTHWRRLGESASKSARTIAGPTTSFV